MSVRLMNAIFDLPIPTTKKMVLLTLGDHADDDGGNCFPSVPTICARSSLGRRTVQTTLRELREEGLLVEVDARPGHAREYRITLGGRTSCAAHHMRGAPDARGGRK